VVEDAAAYRTKEQVLYDLSKALQFSPESLVLNRSGQLSKEQVKRLSGRCFGPVILTFLLAVGPFVVWTSITAGRDQLPFADAFPALLTKITHVSDLMEAQGKMSAITMLGSILLSVAAAAFLAFRIPFALYFDLLDRKVDAQEGRVIAREETINRPNGRDPIEKYFFSLRYLNMPVNLAAYRAIENGSIYIVYLTRRSEILVSIEPKIENPGAAQQAETPAGQHDQKKESPSPSPRAV
jgi:hypothetical protein